MANANTLRVVGLFVGVSLTIAACAVRPSVTYSKITKDSPASADINDSFYLQSSTITIDQAAGTKGDAKGPDQLTVTSTPVEYPGFKIGIKSNSSWLGMVNTTVNLTKIDNTAMIKSAGVETTDNRVADIEAAGKVIASVIPFLGFASSGNALDASKLPWTTKTFTQIEANQTAADAGTAIQMKDGVTITLGALPVDAQPIDRLPLLSDTNAFIYAACRDAKIGFDYRQVANGKVTVATIAKTVKISDPRYFQTVSLPVKGNIVAHSECGVSVTTNASSVASPYDLASALAAQGKAIKDAIDAAKKK